VSDFEILEDQLKNDLGQFLLGIQTFKGVDAVAFQRIDGTAADLSRLL